MKRNLWPKKPYRQSLRQFAFYNIGGVAFFVAGYAIFSILYGIFSWEWWTAKLVGDFTGWTVNYLIQRLIAFKEESKHHTEKAILTRFSIISAINFPLDYAIVATLKLLGLTPFVGLFVSSAFFMIWKFFWYKHWVFKPKKHGVQ